MSLDKNGVVKLRVFYGRDSVRTDIFDLHTNTPLAGDTAEGAEARLFVQGSPNVLFPGEPPRKYVKMEDTTTTPVNRTTTRDVQRDLKYVLHEPSDRL